MIEIFENQIIKNVGSNKTKGPKQDIIAFFDCSSRSRSLQLCFVIRFSSFAYIQPLLLLAFYVHRIRCKYGFRVLAR